MPTVPETFAPSVSRGETPLVPATGPWVAPMRNAAPGMLQQTGQTLARAGAQQTELGNTIGDRIEETMDAGLTKAAETQFLKTSQDILYNPQSGYLNTRGLDAQTQWESTAQALVKARQDARATLTNPIQQHGYDLAANDHALTLSRTMADHKHQQVTQFGIQQSQDRADSMNILAKGAFLGGRMDDYQKYAEQATNEVLHVASLNGAAPDSDVAKAMLRAKRTDLVHGITTGLLDNHQYEQAKQFFDAERDNIDMRTSEQLGNAVKIEYDRNLTETKGDAFLASAQSGGKTPYTYGSLATGSTINPSKITDIPGSPRPDGRVHDGYDIAMPQGTQVTAPLDGKVVKVWNDEKFDGGLSMRVELADGNTLGVAHLSSANLKEGDAVNRGQVIALSGKTGNATGAVLHVALQDKDGKYVDYFSASKAQPNQAGVADPNVLEKAIEMAKNDDSLDPFQQKQTIRYMESQHSHERAIQEQQYQENKRSVVDQLVQNGGRLDQIPAAQKAMLRPSDLQDFQQGLDEDARKRAEVPIRMNWMDHPEQQTVAAVDEAYAKHQLTTSTYWTARKEAAELEADPDKIQQANIDHKQLQSILELNQLSSLAYPKSLDDKQERDNLETAIKSEINNQQLQAKRKLTWDEKAKLARSMVVDKVYTASPWYSSQVNQGLKPVSITTQDEQDKATVWVGNQSVRMLDIPAKYTLQAISELRAHGADPTEANIAAWWLKAGRPAR